MEHNYQVHSSGYAFDVKKSVEYCLIEGRAACKHFIETGDVGGLKIMGNDKFDEDMEMYSPGMPGESTQLKEHRERLKQEATAREQIHKAIKPSSFSKLGTTAKYLPNKPTWQSEFYEPDCLNNPADKYIFGVRKPK